MTNTSVPTAGVADVLNSTINCKPLESVTLIVSPSIIVAPLGNVIVVPTIPIGDDGFTPEPTIKSLAVNSKAAGDDGSATSSTTKFRL